MKVISFNIRNAEDPDGHSVDERAPRLKKILDKEDADLLGLQEVTPRWLAHLQADYGDRYEIFSRYRAAGDEEATPILWKRDRFDCLDRGFFWLSDTPETESRGWDAYGCCRIVLWTLLRDRDTDRKFTFINTHFGFGDEGQVLSARLIGRLAQERFQKPVVLTGDFNLEPTSPGYAELTRYFRDAAREAAGDPGPTFHGYLKEPGRHIDYCFFTPGAIKPLSSRLLNERFEGRFPSDHYGVCSGFDFL